MKRREEVFPGASVDDAGAGAATAVLSEKVVLSESLAS